MTNLSFHRWQHKFKTHQMPLWIFVLALLAAVVISSFGTALILGPRKVSSVAAGIIGQEMRTKDASLTVHGTRRDSVGAGPLMPREGYEFVIADITLRNNSDTDFELIPFLHFHVRDSQARVFLVTALPDGTNQWSGKLLAHDSIREEVGFEVAKGSSGLRLYYEPGITGRDIIVVSLQTKSRWKLF